MTKGKELTDYQKGQIEGRSESKSHSDIGKELNILHRTISNFLKRLKLRENKENLPHPGCPRKFIQSDDRYLVYAAEADADQTLKELRNTINIGISIQTIRGRFREAGIRKWCAKQGALLTKEQAALRYQWIKDHRHFTRNEFAFIIFSDESLVKKNSNSRIRQIFRHQNKAEMYAPKNMKGKKKGSGLSQMI